MALLKFLRRKDTPEAADTNRRGDRAASQIPAASEAVERARQQARRRLMGAVVLLGIGIIGFPILFQTQPRPIPVDLPIEIPRKDKVPPLEVPAARPAGEGEGRGGAAAPLTALTAPTTPAAAAPSAGTTATAPESIRTPAPAPASAPAPAPSPASSPASSPAVKETVLESAPAPTNIQPPATSTAPAAPSSKQASAAASIEAAASDADARARFIVQVGAFAENEKVREVRAQLERMGLKTYTQEVTVNGERRVRVRLGPFKTRQEAADTLARIKAAGLPGALLAL